MLGSTRGLILCIFRSLIRGALNSGSSPASLSWVHPQLWLHLHLGNRTSALQRSSGLHGAEVGVGVEQAAPPLPSPSRRGAGERKWQQRPPRLF